MRLEELWTILIHFNGLEIIKEVILDSVGTILLIGTSTVFVSAKVQAWLQDFSRHVLQKSCTQIKIGEDVDGKFD